MCPNIKIYKDLMKNFEELGLSPEIRRAIEEMGYECPMPVQEEVIPYLLHKQERGKPPHSACHLSKKLM